MCYAVQGTKPLWKNTNVTVCDIRAVFEHSPCLICVLAKKRKEGIVQWKPRKMYKKLRIGKEQSDTKDWKSSNTKEMNQQDESDAKRHKSGELLSCDSVIPVNPKSFEGYVQSFIWRDRSTKRIFFHSDKEASEDSGICTSKDSRSSVCTTRDTESRSRSFDPTTSLHSSLGRYARTTPGTVSRANPAHPTNIGRTQSKGTSRR